MDKRKVLYVFGGEKASGAEIVIERLISYNLESVEAHLFISPGDFATRLLNANKPYPIITIENLKKLNRSSESKLSFYFKAIKNYFLISSTVLKYCRIKSINVIHANTIVPASYLIPAVIYSKILRQKKRWLWSDHDVKYFSPIDHYIAALCVWLFNKTLVVSNAVKAKYKNTERIQVLYNGLDLNIFNPNAALRSNFRNLYKLEESDQILGIVATISPRKGQLELIQVFKKILSIRKSIYLFVAGSLGSDDQGYNIAVMKAIESIPNVKYLGHINNIVEFYNGCDIIVNNSNEEGSEPLGTTIYEAMACEKIVIASNVGGTPEIIENGVDGLIFENFENKELCSALDITLNHLSSFEPLKKKAREKVARLFDISEMVLKYNKIVF